jgi:hypothetical protein
VELDVIGAVLGGVDPLVVVVHRHREALLGAVLSDDVLVEDVIYLFRLRDIAKPKILVDVFIKLFFDYLVAELDAFVADVDAGARDEFTYLLLRFAAEAALQLTLLVPESEHATSLT